MPNNTFGYGKLSAFGGVLTNFVYGCTDTAALNYDPAANINDGSCIAIVNGCMDAIAVNFDPLANFDNGTCQYDTMLIGINNALADGMGLGAYPNPSNGSFYMVYSLPNHLAQASITITDVLGKEVMLLNIEGASGKVAVHNLSKGVYLYALHYEGRLQKPGKLIVQ
jgi:hypothetical protein